MDTKFGNKGAITIEASISFTIFLFLVLFFISFGQVYRTQNIISHATLQAAKGISYESIYRGTQSGSETVKLGTDITTVMKGFSQFSKVLFGTSFDVPEAPGVGFDDDTVNVEDCIKDSFTSYLDTTDADEYISQLGIADGMEGLDFSDSQIGKEDVVIHVRYQIRISFPILGERYINSVQTAKVRLFNTIEKKHKVKDELKEVTV